MIVDPGNSIPPLERLTVAQLVFVSRLPFAVSRVRNSTVPRPESQPDPKTVPPQPAPAEEDEDADGAPAGEEDKTAEDNEDTNEGTP
jgi:hypothetical protein